MMKKKIITIMTAASVLMTSAPCVFAEGENSGSTPAVVVGVETPDTISADEHETMPVPDGEIPPVPENIPLTPDGAPVIEDTGANSNENMPEIPGYQPAPEIPDETVPKEPEVDTHLLYEDTVPIPMGGGNQTDYHEMMFTDVQEGAWFYESVKKAYERGIISGMSDDVFAPDNTVTAAQFVMMIYKAAGNFISAQQRTNWYDEAVDWAEHNEIITYIPEWSFDAEAELSREQMMLLIYNYMVYRGYVTMDEKSQTDLSQFADGDSVSSYAVTAAHWLTKNGHIVGDGGMLRPASTLTRAEAAVILMNVLN